jgi:hypothetical protein
MCGTYGTAKDAPAGPHALENAAKNNLCAHNTPVVVSFRTFERLQAALENAAVGRWPEDRSVLRHMARSDTGVRVGEGTLVRLVAYTKKVRRGGSETVNCQLTKGALVDLHVVLVPQPDADECDSITAEVIPHYRPLAWTADRIDTPMVPMRFTGQLFVDTSHVPCENGPVGTNPQRFTIWEIHPVYAIDVCKFAVIQRCKASDNKAWVPLDQWQEPSEE